MTPDPSSDLRARLESLRRGYLRHLEERVAAIEATWGQDSPDLAQLFRLAHGLVGSGGTYGFPQISAAAAELEKLISEIQQRSAGPDLDEKNRIVASMGALRDLMIRLKSPSA